MHIGYKHIFFFHYSRLRTNLKCSFLVAQRSAREMPNSADKTLQKNTVKTPMTTERKTGARNMVKYTNSLSGGLSDLDVKKTSIQSNTMAQRYSMTLTEVRRWRPRWCYYNIIHPQCVFRYHLVAHIRHCQLSFFLKSTDIMKFFGVTENLHIHYIDIPILYISYRNSNRDDPSLF